MAKSIRRIIMDGRVTRSTCCAAWSIKFKRETWNGVTGETSFVVRNIRAAQELNSIQCFVDRLLIKFSLANWQLLERMAQSTLDMWLIQHWNCSSRNQYSSITNEERENAASSCVDLIWKCYGYLWLIVEQCIPRYWYCERILMTATKINMGRWIVFAV